MSNELRALQQRFQDYLTGNSEQFEQDIVSTADALAEHRLGAYYNAYRIRLIDCLATDFSGLQTELGEEDFALLVLDYLQRYPSQQPSVRWVGQHMVEFLQQSDHADKDFLAELAEFEWAQGLCFDAADSSQIFRPEQMAEIAAEAWPLLQLQFHPSLRWLDLHWNAVPYWVALDNKEPPPAKQQEQNPTRWLLWRQQMNPHWRSLDVAEAWAIQAASEGANFAELCEGLLEWIGEESVALTAAGYLKQWIHDELIVAVSTG
ncbi:MAG: DNA-binding domain-containing protein [Gammaproteobacteria bacterium]|nr:DNA-binding domain-containing protein [Gammaproteobacteria bacterium]